MGKKLALKWITDVIGQDYKNWNLGDYIIIDSQTGTGKTYFILNKLLNNIQLQDSVLYVCNRTNLKRKIKVDLLKHYGLYNKKLNNSAIDKIKWIKNVRVTSYQELFFNNIDKIYEDVTGNGVEPNKAKYLIFDECQFLFEDAGFCNKIQYTYTDIIEKKLSFVIKIFISATMDELKGDIIKSCKNMSKNSYPKIYSTGRDYSYLNPKYFKKIDNITNLILNDKTDNKWLVFTSSKAKGEKMQKVLGNDISTIIKAGTTNSSELNNIVNDSCFKKKVLITTKVLENGIDIKDDKLKNLVVMTYDKISFIQEIGRKRINIEDADIVNLYIPQNEIRTFRTFCKLYDDKLEYVDLYNKDINKFNKIFDNDLKLFHKLYLNEIFYRDNKTGTYKINYIGLHRLELDKKFAIKMMALFKKDKFAYIKEQLNWLHLKNTFNKNKLIEDVVLDTQLIELKNYLDSIKGTVILLVNDRKELIEKIGLIDYNHSSIKNGNIKYIKNKNTLNSYLLHDLNTNYYIEEFPTSRIINGSKKKFKHAWRIKSLDDK
jgi:superfamily II DNA/RNA helicase